MLTLKSRRARADIVALVIENRRLRRCRIALDDVECPRAHSKEVENASHLQGAVGTGFPDTNACGRRAESRIQLHPHSTDESREPVALQTVIAKYVPASGEKGVEIDLVAVVHIGEKAYYERLNKEFEKYDAVLYELVAPEGISPRRVESRRATTRSPCSSRA